MDFFKKVFGVFTKKVDDTSPAKTVNSTDIAKVFRTAGILGASAAVSHVLANLQPEMFGQYEMVATVVIMLLSELSIKFLKNNK